MMLCHSHQQVSHASTWRRDVRPYAMADKPDSCREQRETPVVLPRLRGYRTAVRHGVQPAPILRTLGDIADDDANGKQQRPLNTKAFRALAPWSSNCLLMQGDCQSCSRAAYRHCNIVRRPTTGHVEMAGPGSGDD